MKKFQFARIARKYYTSYTMIRTGAGEYDADGVFRPGADQRKEMSGTIQPISIKELELEGGKYTSDDRVLYTSEKHETGDLIEYQGVRYEVDAAEIREYSDVGKYMLRKVNSLDPL